jgi:gluconolactonase
MVSVAVAITPQRSFATPAAPPWLDARRYLALMIASHAGVERIATGFEFTEGPVWHPHDRTLIFSDIVGNRMHRWSATGGITTFRQPSNMANGNAYDRQGRLVTCEHATSRVTRTDHDGSVVVLASHHQGRQLNSPNDVVVRSDGSIFFTDPTAGRREYYGIPREPDLDVRGVYRVDPDGRLHLLVDDFDQPNGLCFSLDERRLFVNDSPRRHIRVFDVTSDGALSSGAIWAVVGGAEGDRVPDGMKIDSAGNVWCAGPGGIHVFAPDALRMAVVPFPEDVANFAWGDDDLCSLYATASTSVYRVRVTTPGLPAF